jgi:hypothetical protein
MTLAQTNPWHSPLHSPDRHADLSNRRHRPHRNCVPIEHCWYEKHVGKILLDVGLPRLRLRHTHLYTMAHLRLPIDALMARTTRVSVSYYCDLLSHATGPLLATTAALGRHPLPVTSVLWDTGTRETPSVEVEKATVDLGMQECQETVESKVGREEVN